MSLGRRGGRRGGRRNSNFDYRDLTVAQQEQFAREHEARLAADKAQRDRVNKPVSSSKRYLGAGAIALIIALFFLGNSTLGTLLFVGGIIALIRGAWILIFKTPSA